MWLRYVGYVCLCFLDMLQYLFYLFVWQVYQAVHLLLVGPERGHFEVHEARGSRLVSRHISVVVCLKRLHAMKSTEIPELPQPGGQNCIHQES